MLTVRDNYYYILQDMLYLESSGKNIKSGYSQ